MPTHFRCSLPGYYFYCFLSARQYLTMDLCILCDESLNDRRLIVSLQHKGCDGLNKANKKRQTVHQDCRRNHCNPRIINSAQVNVTENIFRTPCHLIQYTMPSDSVHHAI